MNERISVLTSLALVSAMLSVTLLVAWQMLGRARHALIWSIAFAAAALQWLLNIAAILWWADDVVPMATVNILGVVVTVLLLAGFRERSGQPLGVAAALALLATAALAIVAGGASDRLAPLLATPLVARAVLLPLAARVVLPRDRAASAAEVCMAAMLAVFALFSALVAAVTVWRLELLGATAPGLDRQLLLLGLPAAFTGVGLFAVLLLAGDLADRLRRLATSDPLTGVLNRRGFADAAARALANAARQGRPMSVAVADVDRFKSINDQFGHGVGDTVLVRVAGYLANAVRTGDLVGRLGGEEFAILLDGSAGAQALDVVERIRTGLEELELGLDAPIRLTASFGLAMQVPGAAALDAALGAADQALYQAKMAGRNRVVCAPAPAVDRPMVLGVPLAVS